MAADHAHRRSDLVGEPGDQRRHRGEALGGAGAVLGLAQLLLGGLLLARETAAHLGQLPIQVRELLVVLDVVGLDRELRVEQQALHQRDEGAARRAPGRRAATR